MCKEGGILAGLRRPRMCHFWGSHAYIPVFMWCHFFIFTFILKSREYVNHFAKEKKYVWAIHVSQHAKLPKNTSDPTTGVSHAAVCASRVAHTHADWTWTFHGAGVLSAPRAHPSSTRAFQPPAEASVWKRGAPTRSAAGGTREVLLHPNQSGRHAAGNMCGHVASRRNRTNAVAIRWCQTKLIDSYGAGA